LYSDATTLGEPDKAELEVVLQDNQVLLTVYSMRQELTALWARSNASREQLVKDLQDWCSRAERSGIEALEQFSLRLRSYA
jgi:stearoyl-CoA desaturase (delta-9 desaturase)